MKKLTDDLNKLTQGSAKLPEEVMKNKQTTRN